MLGLRKVNQHLQEDKGSGIQVGRLRRMPVLHADKFLCFVHRAS